MPCMPYIDNRLVLYGIMLFQGPSKKDEHMKKMYKIPEPDEVEKKYKDKLRRKCKGNAVRVGTTSAVSGA